MLANSDYTHLEYSPDDKYIIAVSKYNLQQPNKNLHLILAATGQILAEWEWRKTPKDGPKSLKFMADGSLARLVPMSQNAKEPNSIEVYTGGDFS